MTRKSSEDHPTATIGASSHEQIVGVITGKARQRNNLLAFTISGIFVLILVTLLLIGVYFFRNILTPAISIQATTIAVDIVENTENNNTIISNISEKDGMILLYVIAGEFIMGNENSDSAEKPAHSVYLNSFWIDQTEVTNSMFTAFLNSKGNQVEDGATWLDTDASNNHIFQVEDVWKVDSGYENHPATGVSWYGAKAYCSHVARRLPTEAEWEKAASWDERTQKKNDYSWGNFITCDNANFKGCIGETTPVGYYASNVSPYGALDMTGNAWEWVSSLYKSYPYNAKDGRENLSTTNYRVLRGGSWEDVSNHSRTTFRLHSQPARVPTNSFGFRCALSAFE